MKRIIVSLVIIISIIFGVSYLNTMSKEGKDIDVEVNKIVVNESVSIIDKDTPDNNQPYKIDQSSLYYKENPNLKENDIIVSDVSDIAPRGFIRRVVNVYKEDNIYKVETETATLTEVFDELDLKAIIPLTNMKDNQLSSLSNNSITFSKIFNSLIIDDVKAKTFKDVDISYQFNEDIDGIPIEGDIGISASLEINMFVENNELQFSLILNDSVYGNISMGYNWETEREIEYLLSELEGIVTIMAGPIPIVITNEFVLKLKTEAEIEGDISANINISTSNRNGFIYTSNDNSVVEIKDNNFSDGGIEWGTQSNVKGELESGVFMDLTTFLYDYGGTSMCLGINSDINGSIEINDETIDTDEKFIGILKASIYPELEGGIQFNLPILDRRLVEKELFEIEFDPLWSKVFTYGPSVLELEKNIDTDYLMKVLGTTNILKDNYTGDGYLTTYNFNKRKSFTDEEWNMYIARVFINSHHDIDFYRVLDLGNRTTQEIEEYASPYEYCDEAAFTKFLDAIGYNIKEAEYNGEANTVYYDNDLNQYVFEWDGVGSDFKNYYCDFVESRVDEENNKLIVTYNEYYTNSETDEEDLDLMEVILTPKNNSVGYKIEEIKTIKFYTLREIEKYVESKKDNERKLPW